MTARIAAAVLHPMAIVISSLAVFLLAMVWDDLPSIVTMARGQHKDKWWSRQRKSGKHAGRWRWFRHRRHVPRPSIGRIEIAPALPYPDERRRSAQETGTEHYWPARVPAYVGLVGAGSAMTAAPNWTGRGL
jgi:hypothetical protein